MYIPKFNHVLVEIDEKDAKWGTDEGNLGGVVYREGVIRGAGEFFATSDYPELQPEEIGKIVEELKDGTKVMWNEGHEAGTVFEHDNKKYALIYWWDIIGVKE